MAKKESLEHMKSVDCYGKDFVENIEGEFESLSIDNGFWKIQTKKVRKDQVKNNAGGYVFPVSDLNRIRRFLILGTAGGTYYSTEKELTMENLDALVEIINKGKAGDILRKILEISISGRNTKQDAVMLALALCARYRVHDCNAALKSESQEVKLYANYLLEMHKAAISIVNEVCRIPTHLFDFVKQCEFVASETNIIGKGKSTGWGRLMRAAVSNWYSDKSPEKLAFHLTKYRQRNGWSHKDLFRLAHPKPIQNKHSEGHLLEIRQLYQFATKGSLSTRKRKLTSEEWEFEEPDKKFSAVQIENEANSQALDMLDAIQYLNEYTKEEDLIHAIRVYHLAREHIPTVHLNSVSVWRALLEDMPMTAMVRNMGKMSSIEALDSDYLHKVIRKITDEDEIKKSKIHPIQILLAKTVYDCGEGDKGHLKWKVDTKISDGLEIGFYKSFANVPPTGKRFCLAFDVSGSMMDRISGTKLSCREASAAIGLLLLKNEIAGNVKCVCFSSALKELPYNNEWTLTKVVSHMGKQPCGVTDCAQPMLWATKKKQKFDAFIIFTDNETFYGKTHPFQALRNYRKVSGVEDAKLVVLAMTATTFSIADPTDAGMLDIVGFDPAVPQIINDFVLGKV